MGFGKKIGDNLLAVATLLGAWIIFTGRLEPPAILVGVLASLLTVYIVPSSSLHIFSYYALRRLLFLPVFLLYLLFEVFLASYRIAYLSLHPSPGLRSSVFAYDYTLESSTGLLLLCTVITLTPGTIVLDLDTERRRLYIHSLDTVASSRDATTTIRRMEGWLRRIFA